MNERRISKLVQLVLSLVALILSAGMGFAQSAKAAPSNPKTMPNSQATMGARCTTMRCTTNADRKAAAARAAALRTAHLPTAKRIGSAQATFGRLGPPAKLPAVPTQPGCNPTVMNPGGVPDYMSGCVGNYANSPLPSVDPVSGALIGGIRKFVDPLPSIPAAVPDQQTYPNSDYYEISLIQTSQKMHSDLRPTLLRMYVQTNNGMDINGNNVTAPPPAQYLGPLIIAQKDRPVRIKFTNKLPTGAGGNLFIPVDTTIMGAGMGPDGTLYTENRANIHLHGGNTPWISDGTPHQWTVPAGETTSYLKGVGVRDVPLMPAGAGELTLYYTNQQGARLMFYHDHAYGITRLNVYAGAAAGYLLQDTIEATLVNGGPLPSPAGGTITVAPGTIPAAQIPLVIQDKTFIPPVDQLAAQDPTWNWGPKDAVGNYIVGSLWFPHVYMTNQNPSDNSGANAMGRWDWGPWFWPAMDPSTLLPAAAEFACPNPVNPGQMCPGTPQPSLVPEAFMDTPVVNGAAYPVLKVDPKAYRLRILNASNDRSLNLTLYQAVDSKGVVCTTPPAAPAAGQVASCTEVAQVAAPDGIASQGPIPDPLTKGPNMIQIGNETGFITNPVTLTNQPIVYNYNRRDIVVLNVLNKNLWLGPAERADAIVDFSAFAGKTLILYNDSPAPAPAFDTRYDYYTGDPDQTATGGAPTTLPGYGPNTRTIMQIQVAAGIPVPFNPAPLTTVLPAAFAASQPAPIIPEAAYATAYPTIPTTSNSYARIQDTSLFTGSLTGLAINAPGTGYTLPPVVTIGLPATGGTRATATATIAGSAVTGFVLTNSGTGYYSNPLIAITPAPGDTTGTGASAFAVGVPMLRKTIQELFELNYGRMNATLGTELPFTSFNNQTTVPLGYTDAPTESFVDGAPQVWKITHNGVDTHAIHFHLFNVQVINRVGWDGAVRPPDANEIGWKETVKMSPLEDVIVAFKAVKQNLTFSLPDSIRPQDVTTRAGTLIMQYPLDGSAPALAPNTVYNYGQEYVWHCHLLGHEENDMMRPMIFQVAPDAPTSLTVTQIGLGTTASINFVNNSAAVVQADAVAGTTGYTLQRDITNAFLTPVIFQVTATLGSAVPAPVTFTDPSVPKGSTYFYRVQAFTPNGISGWVTAPSFTPAVVRVPLTPVVTHTTSATAQPGSTAVFGGTGSTSYASNPGATPNSYMVDTSAAANPSTPAVLTSPTPGSTLSGSPSTFSWTPGVGVTGYALYLGTTPNGSELYSSGDISATSVSVPGLPTGVAIYARLESLINGVRTSTRCTYRSK